MENPRPTTTSPEGFHSIDELAFVSECAARINAFIVTYPNESRHVLSTFVEYQHELVEVHKHFDSQGTRTNPKPPGATIAALLAAILQTHHGTGYYLIPVMDFDPSSPTFGKLLRVTVKRQTEDGGSKHRA